MKRRQAAKTLVPIAPCGVVLVVEPDGSWRDAIDWALRDSHTCYFASTFEEAVKLLATYKFDVMISDATCCDWDECNLCSLVCKKYPEIAVVATALPNDLRQTVAAMRAGAVGLVIKPFNNSQVARLVGAALSSQTLKGASRKAPAHPACFGEAVPA